MISLRPLSLRSKFILILLGGAVLPLALLGLWLNRTAERSGEELLRTRLNTSLNQVVDEIGLRWLSGRSQLLRLAEAPAVQAALRGSPASPAAGAEAQRQLSALRAGMEGVVESATVVDTSGTVRWTVPSDEGPITATRILPNPALTVRSGGV